MTVSAISGITLEGQPQELSSFIRAGVVYVMWYTPISAVNKRLSWKPHDGLNFTEIIPNTGQIFKNVSALYDPGTDHVVVVWDDATAVDGSNDGLLLAARFNPVTGALVSGPSQLFPGSFPKLAYRTTQSSSSFMLYYRTPKNKGVYGRISEDGGLSWGSGYPLWTGKVADTSRISVASYNLSHASIAQVGSDTRQLREVGMLQRTRPLVSIVKHPTNANEFFIGEPSKFDNVTLTDNLRGALVLSTDNTKLYNLDGGQQGTSDSIGAVARITVTGTTIAVAASAGPTGNGDDVREYSLVPALGTLNVDLPGASYAVDMAVSSTHAYVAEYADNSATAGQFVVVNLSTGTTGTVLSGLSGVRAVAVANFLTPPLIFVATTESGVERLRVYEQNALTPTLLLNTKITSRANSLSASPDPLNPSGAIIYASLVDRLNVYKYSGSALPVQLVGSLVLPGGGSFFRSKVASNGNVFVAAGNAGLLCLSSQGGIIGQVSLSGRVVPSWTRATVYSAGSLVRPREVHQFARSRYYFQTTAGGTSGNSEPSWALTGTVTDNTVSWTPVGLVDGVAVGLELDEANKRVFVVGSAGGNLGTSGRVWLVTAQGLL